jgi:NitT/TauT family transport system permease protein
MSGITYFINQQARYRNFDNVYAAIAMIGIIGFSTDLFLAWLGTILFPWKRKSRSGPGRWAWLAGLWPKAVEPAIIAAPVKAAEDKQESATHVVPRIEAS